MHIALVNGNPAPGSFDDFIARTVDGWEGAGHTVDVFTLRDLSIRPCNGCFHCWWKSPGRCVVPDDTHQIWPVWLKSDIGVWASPLSMGFVSSLLKHLVDRWIPTVHPYIELREGESNHAKRYERSPDLGGLLALGDGDDQRDLQITRQWLERCAWHAHGKLAFCHTDTDAPEEVRHAPDRV